MNGKNLMRRLLAGALALVLLAALALPVWAEDAETETVETKETVHIATVQDLLQLAQDCALDSWSVNRIVVLDADLDLVGQDFNGIPVFNGSFDGQSHTISGLSLVSDGSVVGFFRYLEEKATVQNLTLRGRVMPTGTRSTVGSVAGSNAGTVRSCTFEGVSSGASVVGGLVGENLAGGVVDSCSATGSVYGAHFVGGIVGENHGVVSNCVNKASVNTKVEQNTVELSELTLNDLIGTENVADITDIGGIAGTSGGVVRTCQNLGTVGYQHMGYNVGGIVGSQTGYVYGCINYAKVYARKEAGGIVGQMEPNSTLEYSKDTMEILAEELDDLQTLVDRACDDASAAADDTSARLTVLQGNVTSARAALEKLMQDTSDNVTTGETQTTVDLTELKDSLKATPTPEPEETETPAPDGEGTIIDRYPEPEPQAQPAPEPQPEESPAEQAETESDRAVHGQPTPDPGIAATPNPFAPIDEDFSQWGGDSGSIWSDLSDALPDSVEVTVPTLEVTNQDVIDASKNDLSGTLSAMSDTIAGLNSNGSSNTQTLINDVRAITKQMNKIGNTLAGAGDNTTDPDDLYNDVSDTDTENDTTGKVANCVNRGTVDADINAGGIAGAMARENDLDPEDDYETVGSDSLNFTLKSRVVVRGCVNYGEVTGKKQGAGGIVGNMEMGSALNCWNYGNVTAEDASAVGGVAGSSSAAIIRESGAKCRLSGAKQVGGIAGTGSTIQDCRAMVVLDTGTEQLGAIAGKVEDPHSGDITGNTFVDEGWAALDGVSYAGIAEPLSYADFTAQEGLPAAFQKITVRFCTENETVAELTVPYGGSVSESEYPGVPTKEGSYGEWPDTDLSCVTFDVVMQAEYHDKTTTLQSEQQRDGRAVLLVEGRFDTADTFALQTSEDTPDAKTELLECWALPMQDGLAHTVRYLPTQDPDTVSLWLKTAAGWQQIEATVDGSYLSFTAPAEATAFAAVSKPQSPVLYAAIGGSAAVVLLVILLRKRRKAKKKAAKAAKESHKTEESKQ